MNGLVLKKKNILNRTLEFAAAMVINLPSQKISIGSNPSSLIKSNLAGGVSLHIISFVFTK